MNADQLITKTPTPKEQFINRFIGLESHNIAQYPAIDVPLVFFGIANLILDSLQSSYKDFFVSDADRAFYGLGIIIFCALSLQAAFNIPTPKIIKKGLKEIFLPEK